PCWSAATRRSWSPSARRCGTSSGVSASPPGSWPARLPPSWKASRWRQPSRWAPERPSFSESKQAALVVPGDPGPFLRGQLAVLVGAQHVARVDQELVAPEQDLLNPGAADRGADQPAPRPGAAELEVKVVRRGRRLDGLLGGHPRAGVGDDDVQAREGARQG